MSKKYIAWLRAHGACDEAIVWSESRADFATCYSECEDPDWLLWLLDHAGVLDDKRARLYACWCVRTTPLADGRVVWDLLTDERSRMAVEVAERHAVGEATDGELATARSAAWNAAGASAWASAWASTNAAAWSAAWDAAGASVWASANASANAAARAVARTAQCSRIRVVWPVDEVAAAIT